MKSDVLYDLLLQQRKIFPGVIHVYTSVYHNNLLLVSYTLLLTVLTNNDHLL